MLTKMLRVSKKMPCPVCDKPDWCLLAQDGSAAICQRIQKGSVKICGDAGYLHLLTNQPIDRQCCSRQAIMEKQYESSDKDFTALQQQYYRQIKDEQIINLSQQIELSSHSLKRLGIGWAKEHRAWSFPMSDKDGMVRGIRLRSWHGGKWSVKGGREGLFIPTGQEHVYQLLVAEGPTDTAALLDLGFGVVGRPSARGGEALLLQLIQQVKPESVVVVADTDQVGVDGAEQFAKKTRLYVRQVKIISPPPNIKDMRAWKQLGATRKDILVAIDSAPLCGLIIEDSN